MALLKYIAGRPYLMLFIGIVVLVVFFEMQSVPRPFAALILAMYAVVSVANILKMRPPSTATFFDRIVTFVNRNGFITGLIIACVFGVVIWLTGAFNGPLR